jgi:kynureninase
MIRSAAEELDRSDPLARWRDEFVFPDPDLIYLDGNSLGRTPRRAVDALRTVVDEQWANDLITSWWEHGWLDLPLTVGDLLAPVIGARPGEVAVHDSTTVCLYQLVNVALDLTDGHVIAVADSEFPTDRYVVDGIARLRPGVTIRRGVDDLDGVDVVVRSHVDYRTAQVAPLAEETARADAAGATTVWDLSHAAGVLDVDLTSAGVRLAAGCTYKFLNGGPGSPAFTYVRESIVDDVVQPIWGWFGQRDQFAMDDPFEARAGVAKMLNGTPAVLGLTGARAGIEVTVEAGIGAIASKARALGSFAIDVAESLGLTCTTARPPVSSGGHISVTHPDATRLQRELVTRGVVVDKREPDVLRFGLSPLTTRFVDAFDGLTLLADLVDG